MYKAKALVPGVILGLLSGGILMHSFMHSKFQKANRHYLEVINNHKAVLDSINRNTYQQLMGNVLTKIDEDLIASPEKILSDKTIARIKAACYAFKPYRYFENDTVSDRKLSPERGHLLLMIIAMNMDSTSLQKIMYQTDFSYADLKGADLHDANLKGINLSGADMREANLVGTILTNANLSSANLWGANLSYSKMNSVNLDRADLSWSNVNHADMRNGILNGAILVSSQLRNINFTSAMIKWADANGAFFNHSVLGSADLTGTNFTKAQFVSASLDSTLLLRSNLTDSNLENADLTGADLHKAVVKDHTWLVNLNNIHMMGKEHIQATYEIKMDKSVNPPVYRLEKKPAGEKQ